MAHHIKQRVEYSFCPHCGKRSYMSRRDAKIAMRRAHSKDKMSAYRCRETGPDDPVERWHFGHLAEPIKQGIVDRDTVYSGKYRDSFIDKKDVNNMPTIAEIANFSQFNQSLSIPEPTAPALTQAQFAYNSLKEFAQTTESGFQRYNKDGIDGWIGHLSLKTYIDDLIPPKQDWNSHQRHSRTRSVSEMLNRHKIVICLDHSGKLQGVKPTYFIAANGSVLDRLTPGKMIDPPVGNPEAPSTKKSGTRARSSSRGAYTKGYDLLAKSVNKILKNAYNNHQIAVLGSELYELADFSALIKAGREKPTATGFYSWMRDRSKHGDFASRMETPEEYNARPNAQGGRRTYYYAPKGVEVPSMTHGEILSTYLNEAFNEAAPAPAPAPTPEPVAAVVEAAPVVSAPPVSVVAGPLPRVIMSLTESIQVLAESGIAGDAGMSTAVRHLSDALVAMTNG